MEKQAYILLMALVLDAFIGDPDWLWRRVRHPVVWFGKAIDLADRLGNSGVWSFFLRRFNGLIAISILVGSAAMMGVIVGRFCDEMGWGGEILQAVFASIFLAQRSLWVHVKAVGSALYKEGIESARHEVGKIVGRDPQALDEAGICRAAIESLSENSSDGVIAPACWFLVLGLPGLLAYKMLNTADSMIGHKNARFYAFGFFAARLDDLANYLPARLTALLVTIAALWQLGLKAARQAAQVSLKEAKKHRSPNAGWPESAYAGALGVSLAGPRSYGNQQIDAPYQNEKGRPPHLADIACALTLFGYSLVVFYLLVAFFILFLLMFSFM